MNYLHAHLSVFSSSGTKSLRFARTSYFSFCFFLPSLYFPGRSIPVSVNSKSERTLIDSKPPLSADFRWLDPNRGEEVASLEQSSDRPVQARCWRRSGQLTWEIGFQVRHLNSETLLESHPSIRLRPDDGPGPGRLPRPALRAARTPGTPWGHLAVNHWGRDSN